MSVPHEHVLVLSIALFAIGLVGVVARRNLVFVLLSTLLMLNAGVLAIVGFHRTHGLGGEVFALVVMFVAVAEAVLGLGVVAAWLRNRDSLDVDAASTLRW